MAAMMEKTKYPERIANNKINARPAPTRVAAVAALRLERSSNRHPGIQS